VSRLTDLLRQARRADAQLGADLEAEFRALTARRTFGLVFERHQPEEVELPQRPVRKGDKVHILPSRGDTARGDRRVWSVVRFENAAGNQKAHLVELGTDASESCEELVENLVVVAEFRDPIYPGLIETGRVTRGGEKPFHSVINAENYHALELLTYTHRGVVDVIYIDPPYNSGARDWTYNNDYVESDDNYRHSKWLAFMERRLRLARELLNPESSVLILTIDEKEYLRVGLLLEQIFPEAHIQMVSSVVNRKGVPRQREFARVDEYLFFVLLGTCGPALYFHDMLSDPRPVESEGEDVTWIGLRRRGSEWRRSDRPSSFYPLFVDQETAQIKDVGTPLAPTESRQVVADRAGCITVWPLNSRGDEARWQLSPANVMSMVADGDVRSSFQRNGVGVRIEYLSEGLRTQIEEGSIEVVGLDEHGAKIVRHIGGRRQQAKTVWNLDSHGATAYGTQLVSALLGGRRFPYPKSLYAVEDALRFFVGGKPDAVIVDFFAGSGTTAHAVMRLNHGDAGRRQCISVTNNEVAAADQVALRQQNLRPGDLDWERLGICDHITKPRIEAAITGQTPDGEPIQGDYKFIDEFPISNGLDENAVFFTLTYEGPLPVAHHRSFGRIAPILWLRAGAHGDIITSLGDEGWAVSDNYGVLEDLDASTGFVKAVIASESLAIAYIITDDDLAFQMVCRDLPLHVTPVQLYESYLQNFELNSGRLG
jgi:adenine-specific DNA-methyltransferase